MMGHAAVASCKAARDWPTGNGKSAIAGSVAEAVSVWQSNGVIIDVRDSISCST